MGVRRTSRAGFTILELMAVIVIIGLLMTIVIGAFTAHVRTARVTTTAAQIRILADAVDSFNMANARYPATLKDLVTKPSSARKWPPGGYLSGGKVPKDKWLNAFKYVLPGASGEYDIISYGADGAPGGEGDAADITNHNLDEL